MPKKSSKADEQINPKNIEEKTLEEYISYGLELREKKDNITWELGDLAIDVTNHFGPTYLADFSKSIGLNVSTMRRYRDISKVYNKDERAEYSVLSWTHFRLVAARDDRLEMLKIAADREWSVEKLQQYIIELGEKERDGDTLDPDDVSAYNTDKLSDEEIQWVLDHVGKCKICHGLHFKDMSKVCMNNGACHE